MPTPSQAGAVAPAQSSIPIDPVGAVLKARMEAAESMSLTLAAQIRDLQATVAAQAAEIERLTPKEKK